MEFKIKDAMLSLDIYAWIEENRDKIEGGFIKKIYQVGEKEFLIKIYKDSTRTLYVNLRGQIFFGERETPDTPSMFAMYLRKRFNNAKIIAVEQVNFDRIINLKTKDYELIFELFGGGNAIVTKEGIIERAYVEREWRHRTVMHGALYTPPLPKNNPINDRDKICEIIENSKKDLVRTLASEYNLGRYAEEVCFRANVNKNAKNVSGEECERLKNAMAELFNFDGCYIYDGFFSPIPMKSLGKEIEHYESFNDCLNKYFAPQEETKIENIKLKNIKEMQLAKIEEFRKEEELNKKIGDKIYEHFQEVEDIISKAKSGEIKRDGKNRIKVNFDGLEFYIFVNLSPGENASVYYDRAKKIREKIKGAKKAIEEIDEKIKKEKRAIKSKKRKRRTFWFEKYRWFISSENKLVIAGRDAKTNEEVVKKHLGDKDLYMHADIHGAPSVVIKTGGEEVGDATLQEAAQFAVSMSKAWNAGFGNLSAYWVYPSQVSKMGESGEYVARGAWVIHGKRNYIHKVALRLAVGWIKYDNTNIVMCAPESALRARTSSYIIIEPGDIKKELGAKKIAEELKAPIDDILRILPPGKLRIIKKA